MSQSGMPLPPPSFEFLVFSLKTQAEVQLGLLSFNPDDKEEEPDLPAARHAIDMMAMLVEKTRGNLSLDEQRLIENALTELRFRFVQVSEQASTGKDARAEEAAGESSPETSASS